MSRAAECRVQLRRSGNSVTAWLFSLPGAPAPHPFVGQGGLSRFAGVSLSRGPPEDHPRPGSGFPHRAVIPQRITPGSSLGAGGSSPPRSRPLPLCSRVRPTRALSQYGARQPSRSPRSASCRLHAWGAVPNQDGRQLCTSSRCARSSTTGPPTSEPTSPSGSSPHRRLLDLLPASPAPRWLGRGSLSRECATTKMAARRRRPVQVLVRSPRSDSGPKGSLRSFSGPSGPRICA